MFCKLWLSPLPNMGNNENNYKRAESEERKKNKVIKYQKSIWQSN